MAKITRQPMKVFGSSSGFQEVTQFGSTAAGGTVYTTNIATIQALNNYLQGWFDAIINGSYPTIQDMNAIHYLFGYQLTYLMQTGIPEWDSTAIYYIGSKVNDGFGGIYTSLTDTNTNNALTDSTNWLPPDASKSAALATNLTIPTGYNYNASFVTVNVGVTLTINGTAVLSGITTLNGTLAVGTSSIIHFN